MWSLKTKGILSSILLTASLGLGQEFNNLSELYNQKQYGKLIEAADSLFKSGIVSPQVQSLVGRAYVDIGQPENALPHLRTVLNTPNIIPGWMNAWCIYYMSKAHAKIGNMDSTHYYLEEALKTKGAKNIVTAAQMDLVSLGFSPVFKNWTTIETNNFRFLFKNSTKVKNTLEYANDRQEAFDSINSFFNSELPKKIDFYVWNNFIEFSRKNKMNSGFAIPELAIVHTRHFQTRGHEMAHVISHFAEKSKSITAFINEGTATCFDLSNRNKTEMAKLARKKSDISIIDIWKSDRIFREIDPNSAYAISGAFVEFLIKEGGKENFLKLLSDQSYENAKVIYGNDLERIVKNFETTIKI